MSQWRQLATSLANPSYVPELEHEGRFLTALQSESSLICCATRFVAGPRSWCQRKRVHERKNSCLGACVRWAFVHHSYIWCLHAVGSGLEFCFAFVYIVFAKGLLLGSCVCWLSMIDWLAPDNCVPCVQVLSYKNCNYLWCYQLTRWYSLLTFTLQSWQSQDSALSMHAKP